MTAITYTAVDRSPIGLASGHSAGVAYSLETQGLMLAPGEDIVGKSSKSLDGTLEAVLNRIELTWDVRTEVITEADMPLWLEWISSVAAGEPFTFDPYGTIASPDDPQTVQLLSYKRARDRSMARYFISFKVKVV